MINITFKRKNNYIIQFEASGHADSAKRGRDLVCAAVSSIITGAFNAIKEIDKIDLTLEDGHAFANVKTISQENENVLNVLYIQLLTVANENKEYIKIQNF